MTEQLEQQKYVILGNETLTPITGGRESIKHCATTLVDIANEMIDKYNRDSYADVDSQLTNVQTVQQAIGAIKDFGCTVFLVVEDTLKIHKEVLSNMLQHDKYFQIRFHRGFKLEVATVEPLAVTDDNLTFQVYTNENDDTLEYLTAPLYIAEDLPRVIQLLVQAHYNEQKVKQVLIVK